MDLKKKACAVFFVTILLLTGVAACAESREARQPDFTFKVSTGWQGPVYSISIFSGAVPQIEFCGTHGTFFLGCRTELLGAKQHQQFELLLHKIRFSRLGSEYKSNRTDCPVYTLCREQPPRKCVRIEDSDEIPAALQNLNIELLRALALNKWVHGSANAVEQLRSEHYDFNQKQGSDQSTILIRAVKKSSPTVVAELLRSGADVNELDSNGNSALDWALDTEYANFKKAELLVGAGANLCHKDADNRTPLENTRVELDRVLLPMTRAQVEKIRELLLSKDRKCN